jgi:hypothetical protein
LNGTEVVKGSMLGNELCKRGFSNSWWSPKKKGRDEVLIVIGFEHALRSNEMLLPHKSI